jgi:hypothetical protein
MKKMVHYLHGTIDLRITWGGGGVDHNLHLTCCVDADY